MPITRFISPDSFTLIELIAGLSLLVFGGIGARGSNPGRILLTAIPEVFRFAADTACVYGVVLTLVILFRRRDCGQVHPYAAGVTVPRPKEPP